MRKIMLRMSVCAAVLAGTTACQPPAADTPARPAAPVAADRALTPDDAADRAYKRVVEAHTGHVTETRTLTGPGGKPVSTRTITGRYAIRSTQASVTVRTTGAGAGSFQVIRDDRDVFVSAPRALGGTPGGWLQYGPVAAMWDLPVEVFRPYPSSVLFLLQTAAGGRRLPPAADGGPRYEVVVQAADAEHLVADRDLRSQLVEDRLLPAAAPTGRLPMQVEAGPDGRLRAVRLDLTPLLARLLPVLQARLGPGAAGARGGRLGYEVRLGGFGQPVSVEPPAPGARRPGAVDPSNLTTGMCLPARARLDRPATLEAYPVVDCAAPHRYEVFGTPRLGAAADGVPAAKAVADRARTGCAQAFARFVGRSRDSSALGTWTITPSESGWQSGDRTAQCILDAGQDVTGTLRGSRR